MNAPSVPSVYEQDTKSHTVYVSGLPDNVTEQAVLAVFVAFGASPAPRLSARPSPAALPSSCASSWPSELTFPNCTASQATFSRFRCRRRHGKDRRADKAREVLVRSPGLSLTDRPRANQPPAVHLAAAKKLRGFAFITFSSSLDAQDAVCPALFALKRPTWQGLPADALSCALQLDGRPDRQL
jgi:RNA recognition motif-containing protein